MAQSPPRGADGLWIPWFLFLWVISTVDCVLERWNVAQSGLMMPIIINIVMNLANFTKFPGLFYLLVRTVCAGNQMPMAENPKMSSQLVIPIFKPPPGNSPLTKYRNKTNFNPEFLSSKVPRGVWQAKYIPSTMHYAPVTSKR